ncbi:noggin-3-like [Halichoeres trimaculatus]|uniref:noggin-3-like n=1 Tax=Halichoeres trimaculatus TaxID=147232 RepID=UPI003D9E1392
MPELLNHGVCWIYVSLLYGSAVLGSLNSTQNQLPNVTLVQEKEDESRDSSFLQLRASIPSYLQPIRPYTLLTSTEDSQCLPKPRHRRPAHLLRLLGSSLDPFWMSIEKPPEASWSRGEGKSLLHGDSPSAKLSSTSSLRREFDVNASPELRQAAANRRQMLEKEAADLDLSSLPSHVSSHVRDWLVQSATCELGYRWVDLGPALWPRWLRQTDCVRADGGRSCSFPGGMECVQAETTHIQILAWNCLEIRGGVGSKKIQTESPHSSTVVEAGEFMKKCSWKAVPYPVITACKCSCK